MADKPDTIVLVHGFWVTPRSWEDWKARYESRGYRVLRPHTPVRGGGRGAERRPDADRGAHGSRGHRASRIRRQRAGRASDPDRSLGRRCLHAAADGSRLRSGRCAINSAPTEGVKVVPLSQIKSTFPVLKNPANRHKAVGFTFEQWRYAFTNTFSEEEARRLYERYHIPASGNVFWAACSQHPPRPRRHLRQLQKPRPCAAPVHLGGETTSCLRRSSARTPSTTRRKARSPRSRVRGPLAPHALAGGMGGGRRLRPDLGRRARIDEGCYSLGRRDPVSERAAAWRITLSAALRSDAYSGL